MTEMLFTDPIDLLRAYVVVRTGVEGRSAPDILGDLLIALERCDRRHQDDTELVYVIGRIRQLATAEAGAIGS
jgi:hypothetical protein